MLAINSFLLSDALNTQNVEVICVILDILQQMVKASDLIGPALIPFYRQLLPMFNAYKAYNGKCIPELTLIPTLLTINIPSFLRQQQRQNRLCSNEKQQPQFID